MRLKILKVLLVLAFSALIVKMFLSLMRESLDIKIHYYNFFKPVVSSEYDDEPEFYITDTPSR